MRDQRREKFSISFRYSSNMRHPNNNINNNVPSLLLMTWQGTSGGVGTAGDTFSGDNLRPCSCDIGVKLTDCEMEAMNQCEALKRTGLRCSC